ncbi:MAG: alpha/beta fold hydrolase [Pirellulaceae bacterium]|nr:alpha/beta fold hydrolase [Pirellulaceae bacterium]
MGISYTHHMAADPAWRRLYPFASHSLVRDGVAQHYVDEGQGRPVLLVHGNPTWSFYWRNLIEPLRCRYRMVAVDHVGCGLSDKPQAYDYTLARHIDNLVALVDHLDLRAATLVAHDWGGAIGLGAALARPTRFRSLVLFNTGAFPPPYIPWRIRACRLPWLGSWCVRRWNLFARAALHMAVARPERMTADVRAGLLAPYDTWEHRVAIDRFVRDIPASPQHGTWRVLEQIERGLPQLEQRPCLLIWGMRDWCFRPVCLERLMAAFPSAEVHRLAHASHYVVEDAHEEIVPILERFLADRSNAGDASPDGDALKTQGVGP